MGVLTILTRLYHGPRVITFYKKDGHVQMDNYFDLLKYQIEELK